MNGKFKGTQNLLRGLRPEVKKRQRRLGAMILAIADQAKNIRSAVAR
jgi:hypothetical protein